MLKRFFSYIDGFVLVMLAAVGLALLAPHFGTGNGPLHLGFVTSIGVSLVFFLHGAALSITKLAEGVRNWRLHLFVQSYTFILFPFIGLLMTFALRALLPAELLLGLFYLCALPSTVSSSVAMVSMARGNVPGAVFNATLSGLIGMAVTPILVSAVMQASAGSIPLGQALLNIALQLLLPFISGQFARSVISDWLGKHKQLITKLDRGVIVLIVYQSFCEATAAGLWEQYGWRTIGTVMALAGALLLVVLMCARWTARRLAFSKEDEITAAFCGSKKSLAYGIPMARVLFIGHPTLGLLMLPLMVYHQLQLIVCSVVAGRYAKRDRIPQRTSE